MRLISLGSGSSGNGFIFQSATTTILIDCGVGIRRTRAALKEIGVIGNVDAVLISHEHSDHVRALSGLMRHESCPVLATSGTLRHLDTAGEQQTLRYGDAVSVGEVSVTAVEVSHDASEPCGFLVSANRQTIAVFTDLGVSNRDVAEAVSQSDTVIVEANYDETMLKSSPYPAMLKRRIRSPYGHLSNDDCSTMLAESLLTGSGNVWLAHLSEVNNDPDLAVSSVNAALKFSGLDVPVRALPRQEVAELLLPV